MKKLIIPTSIFLACFISNSTASAQVIPDNTLSSETSTVKPNVVINGLPNDLIQGGATRGSSLFHSFREFNVQSSHGVYFANPSGINTILTRVTGGNPSNLLGRLGSLGNADLFFMNPSGILFGPNSSFDLNGSFIATTASSMIFSGSNHFSAIDPQTVPALTISRPLGLQFGQKAQPVVNRSQALDSNGIPNGLNVRPGKTFAAIGGELKIQGGIIQAPGGNIELGSISPQSLVRLQPFEMGWTFDYHDVHSFQNIEIDKGSLVSVRPQAGGRIHIQGNNLTLSDGSQILASDSDVIVDIANTLEIEGFVEIPIPGLGLIKIPSTIANETLGSANGKSTIINSKKLFLKNRGTITTRTTGVFNPFTSELILAEGRGGDLIVNASDLVEVNNGGSGLLSSSSSFGAAGNITINTQKLTATDGANIAASSTGTNLLGEPLPTGPGGSITINALESILLSGVSKETRKSSGITSTSEESANGPGGQIFADTGSLFLSNGAVISARTQNNFRGGDIRIESNTLSVTSGGQVLTSTFGSGDAGNIKLAVADRIKLEGSDPTFKVRNKQLEELFGSQEARKLLDPLSSSSGIFASTEIGATGNAGNINIDPKQVLIRDGAGISVDSRGSGLGGSITLFAGNLTLDSQAFISGTSTSGQGGNIFLNIDNLLLLRRNSTISTSAGIADNGGDGGNITINTDLLVALENSNITANAFTGQGGNILIRTLGLPLSPDSEITASSEKGIDGVVEIINPEIDPSSSLSELPEVVDPLQEIVRGCNARDTSKTSSFVFVGRGGVPPGPSELQTAQTVWQDLRSLHIQSSPSTSNSSKQNSKLTSIKNSSFIEAQGWVRNSENQIILTANLPDLPSNDFAPLVSCKGTQ